MKSFEPDEKTKAELKKLAHIKRIFDDAFKAVATESPKDVAAALVSLTMYAMREANVPLPLALEIVRVVAQQIHLVEHATGHRGYQAMLDGVMVMNFEVEPVLTPAKDALPN